MFFDWISIFFGMFSRKLYLFNFEMLWLLVTWQDCSVSNVGNSFCFLVNIGPDVSYKSFCCWFLTEWKNRFPWKIPNNLIHPNPIWVIWSFQKYIGIASLQHVSVSSLFSELDSKLINQGFFKWISPYFLCGWVGLLFTPQHISLNRAYELGCETLSGSKGLGWDPS